MGCNCKSEKKLNNLNNKTIIKQAEYVVDVIIGSKTIEELNDLDKIEIMNMYSLLYPNSSGIPSVEESIVKIKHGIERYKIKYKR